MPVLVLARHAHATHEPGPDHDRPLTAAGEAEARRAGAFLSDFPLDCVIASTARRTVMTAQLAVAEHPHRPTVRTDGALYAGGVRQWCEAMATIPADARGALIVGHMPTVALTVEELAGIRVEKFRPSSLAVFELADWDALGHLLPAPRILDFVT